MFFHDESTFQANDDQSMQSVRKEPSDDEAKGEGQWVMGSDVTDEHNDECKAAEQARPSETKYAREFRTKGCL